MAKLLLSTDHINTGNVRAFSDLLDGFDPTFSARYLMTESGWKGQATYSFTPESHYESDKYSLFYIDVENVDQFLREMKAQSSVLIIGMVNEQYRLNLPPLYVCDKLSQNKLFQRGGEFVVPNNLRQRPMNFTPRCPEPL